MTVLALREAAAAVSAPPVRVLSVSHSAVRAGAARLRYERLADDATLDVTLVVPEVWHEHGQVRPEHGEASKTRLKVEISPARLTRGGPAKWYLHHYPRLGRLIQAHRPDVLHLWEEPWSVVALQAARLRDKLAPNAALVLETDQNIYRKLPIGFEQIRRYTLARTDLLIARSDEALAVARTSGFQGAHEFVEYGIDTETFYPRAPSVPGPAQGHLKGRPFRIGYVGRLVPEKGLMDIVEAVRRCGRPVEFELLGDGPERASIMSRAAADGLGGRVRLLKSRDAAGVGAFMTTLDALVLMSRTTRTWKEQFGRVIMEAHACGVPVIGSSSGSIPKIVGPGGWIVPEGDIGALSTLLDRLAAAPEEVAAAAAAGSDWVRRRFSFAIVSADLRRAWLRAAEIRRGPQA